MVDGEPRVLQPDAKTSMRIDLQMSSGITLKLASGLSSEPSYSTARIQKGLILIYEGQELCEEAVGFGVPVLKRGLQTIFPGEVELFPLVDGYIDKIRARFKMDLEERIRKAGTGTIRNPIVYRTKNIFAALIRRLPATRNLLTRTSNLLRSRLSWETTYEPSSFCTWITLTYSVDPNTSRIMVGLDERELGQSGVSEVIVMNEQGARLFDQYQDTNGLSLVDREIGCWDQVWADKAMFISRQLGISFSVSRVNGASLYRGRELIGSRLAWAGFGYSFPPSLTDFNYEIKVSRQP